MSSTKLSIVLILTTFAPSTLTAQLAVKKSVVKGQVILSNRFLQLTFVPDRGGRCTEFLLRDANEQLIGKTSVDGMFIDHWAKYAWPSGLMHLPYKHKILREGSKRIGIRLSVTVPKFGGGKGSRDRTTSMKMETAEDLVGLTIEKTIWLTLNSDLVRVDQAVINSTKESRAAGLYIQQNMRMNGSHYSDSWYLPSTNGIEVNLQPDQRGGRTIGPNFIEEPVGGWMAVKDRKTNRGLLFTFDYNYLRKTYTSGATGEWFMEPVPIGPGKSFRTQYAIKPVKGFKDFVHGSSRTVADIQADEIGKGKVRIRHRLAAVSNDLRNVNVLVQVVGWKSKKLQATKSFRLKKLTGKHVQQELTLAPSALKKGVVISVNIRVGKREERYEYFYAGDKAEHDARFNLFATAGGGLAGVRGDRYYRAQPAKRKMIAKPDFAKLSVAGSDRFRCLVVFGLFTHILNLDDAVAKWKYRGKPVEFSWANCPPNGVERFPGTYQELFTYNLVVLSDVNYKALGDVALEMLCDYVQQGGSLLVVGGPYAYGNGEFQGTRFLDLLPVRLRGPFDLKWAGKGKSWQLTPKAQRHELLKGVGFKQKPSVFWHHFVTPKKESKVVLQAGKQPALILGRYGKGRVAVLTLSPTGFAANKGEVAWWSWKGWFPLVRNIFRWAGEVKQ